MMPGELPTSDAIQAEHDRLGHQLGWRLLYSPAQTIDSAKVALITANPGGSKYEDPCWSVENGSAYVLERWKNCAPGSEKLQRQVCRMFDVLTVQPEEA